MPANFEGKYQIPKNAETESEPGSRGRVLKNLLGVKSKRELDQIEYDYLLHAQSLSFTLVTSETRFSANTICELHRSWLGEVFEWAGRYRTVELSKDGFSWPPAGRVAPNMEAFERQLLAKYTPCVPNSLPIVARQIAEVHAELLFIHPFREGNGRLARWIADLMALQAGYPPADLQFYGSGSKEMWSRYLNAVTRGYVQDYDFLSELFREAIELRLPAST